VDSVLELLAAIPVEDCVGVGVGAFDAAVTNDLVEDIEGIEGMDGTELDFVETATKGDADILTLLARDVAADADDFTFGVPRGVEMGVGTGVETGVGVLLGILGIFGILGIVDFELGTDGMSGTLDISDFDVSILLKAGAALVVALVLVDGGPDTSENDGILEFTGVGVFATSGEGDGAGVAL
jgi:hypothetical protein